MGVITIKKGKLEKKITIGKCNFEKVKVFFSIYANWFLAFQPPSENGFL